MLRKSLSNGYTGLLLLIIISVVVLIFVSQTGLLSSSEEGEGIMDRIKEALGKLKKAPDNVKENYRFDPEEEERKIDNLN